MQPTSHKPKDTSDVGAVHVRTHMTAAPYSIGVNDPIAKAHELMRAHRIRHLPVLRGAELVGIVTQRDLYLVETLRDVDPTTVTVEEAMTQDAYTVPPRAPLAKVAKEMSEKRLGCAVVMEEGYVVGIFTAVDALRALSKLLEGQAHAGARERS